MRTFPMPWRGRFSLALTMVLLLVGCVSAALAYEALRVERAHRRAAERAMYDFASFAAWEFASRAREELQTSILPFFRPLTPARSLPDGSPLPEPAVLQPAADKVSECGCPVADSTGVYFRLLLPSRELTTACGIGPVVAETEGMRLIARHAASAYLPQWEFATLPIPDDSFPGVVAYTVLNRGGGPRAVYGFHTSLSGFGGPAFRRVLAGEPLLPRSLAPADQEDSLFSVVLALVSFRQLRRERELARMRESFVSGVSHELRTPLSQIRICAEMLRLGRIRSEAERVRSLDMIDRQAVHLSRLVDNVLHFSRSEVPGAQVDPVHADVGQAVRGIVDDFRPLAAARRVELTVEAEDGLVAPVDRDALEQVVVNLLDNAVKHGPEDQTVSVGVSRAAGSGVRVWVDDQGPGVPPADRSRIFDPFVRLGKGARGSGIGLSVVRDLVQQHGGDVWVEDAPGGGARFVIELWRIPFLPGDIFRPRDAVALRAGTGQGQGVA